MNNVIHNHPFDEIALSDSAMISRNVRRDDLALIAGLVGTAGERSASPGLEKAIPAGAGALWCEALVAEALHTRLPGPGTRLVAQSVHLDGEMYVGETITARVKVTDRQDKTHAVAFDWACFDEQGEKVASGNSTVIAPTEKRAVETAEVPKFRIKRHDKYQLLIERSRALPPVPTAVAYPCDESALEAVMDAANAGIILPLLVGPAKKIEDAAAALGADLARWEVIDVPDSAGAAGLAAEKAVELVRLGKAHLLMKGSLHTDVLMSAVVKREGGLRTRRRVSHCFIFDVPTYPKPLIVTDGAINIAPALEDKVDIIQNAIDLAHVMGIAEPRVAILSAVETVNPKIQSTIDAAVLCKMADRGQITGGRLDGPLALDNAISATAARIKGIASDVAGQADILVVPDLEAGNMLAKNLSFLAEADAAGIVLGARIPIILTSRADSVEVRIASCAVGALYAHRTRNAG